MARLQIIVGEIELEDCMITMTTERLPFWKRAVVAAVLHFNICKMFLCGVLEIKYQGDCTVRNYAKAKLSIGRAEGDEIPDWPGPAPLVFRCPKCGDHCQHSALDDAGNGWRSWFCVRCQKGYDTPIQVEPPVDGPQSDPFQGRPDDYPCRACARVADFTSGLERCDDQPCGALITYNHSRSTATPASTT